MRRFVLLFLLTQSANALTLFYVDPDYTGGGNVGSSSHPWTSQGAIVWSTINSTLASDDVTIFFSALKANGTTQQTQSASLHPQRSDSSTHRLTIDGYSFYNSNTTTPNWLANPNSATTAYTNHQVFNIAANTLGWYRSDAQVSSSTVSQSGLNYQCIHSHISGASTQPGIGASWSNYWATPASASPGGAWVTATAYADLSRQDNVTVTGFECNGGQAAFMGDNLVLSNLYIHDNVGQGQPGLTMLYTTYPDQATPFTIIAPCTNLLIHDFRIHNSAGEGMYVGAVNPDASAAFQVKQTNQMNGLVISNFWIDATGLTAGQGDGIDHKNGIINETISHGHIGDGHNRMGGIIVGQTQTPAVSQNLVIDSVEIDNSAPTGPGGTSEGEAIYMNSSSIAGGTKGYNGVTIRNCSLNNNWIGILCFDGGGAVTNINIYNCSVRGTTNAPGIQLTPDDTTLSQFKNNVCWNNNGGASQYSLSASVTRANNAYGGGTGGAGDISGVIDADFVNAAVGDFHIASVNKREVDVGATIGSFSTDADGNTRPSGTAWDIGAFEFQQGGNVAPSISVQPQSQSIGTGGTATFTVVGHGTPLPTFQWNLNGVNIPGATLTSYTTNGVPANRNGDIYTVGLTNSVGGILSAQAVLTVINPPNTFFVSPNGSSSNDGSTTNTPWPLDWAVTHVQNGNTINLMSGLYTGGPWGITNEGITIQALTRWGPKFYNNASDGNGGIIRALTNGGAYNIDNLTIDGLQFSNTQYEAIEIMTFGHTNLVIRNCWIQQIQKTWNGPNFQNATAIYVQGGTGDIIERNLCEWNGTNSPGFNHGAYLTALTNCIIRNNVLRYNGGYGIIANPHTLYDDGNQIYQNLIYGNITGNATHDQLALYADNATGKTYCWGNTVISDSTVAIVCQQGTRYITNNIILSTSEGIHTYNSTTTIADYNLAQQSLSPNNGPHDVISATPNFVNSANGLYWLLSTSPARGAALAGVFGPVNFFGTAQTSVADIGAFQYSINYTNDQRVLDPSSVNGSDYWTNLPAGPPLPPVGGINVIINSMSVSNAFIPQH